MKSRRVIQRILAVGVLLLLAVPGTSFAQAGASLARLVRSGRSLMEEGRAAQTLVSGSERAAFVFAVRSGRGAELLEAAPDLEPLVESLKSSRILKTGEGCSLLQAAELAGVSESIDAAAIAAAKNGRPKVVVVGGGFGGQAALETLGKADVDVILLDRNSEFVFQPLLYQVATGRLRPDQITRPLDEIAETVPNATFRQGSVKSVNAAEHKVTLAEGGEITYDKLIVAAGTRTGYFGNAAWAQVAPGLKTIDDSLKIRELALESLQEADRLLLRLDEIADPAVRAARRQEIIDQYLTFVVVGGGPTGVEVAGGLEEMLAPFWQQLHRCTAEDVRVILVHGGDRILPSFPEHLSRKATEALAERGVEMRLNQRVTDMGKHTVSIGETQIEGRPIWTAGVEASPLGKALGAPLDRAGRVRVQPDLTVPGSEDVYVVGDLAAVEINGSPVPGVAPAAEQGGKQAADNALRSLEGKETVPFDYQDPGSMAVVGRGDAVVDAGGVKLSSWPGWSAWLGVHIYKMPGGMMNRLRAVGANLRRVPSEAHPH